MSVPKNIKINLPESAKLHWGYIFKGMERWEEDIVYLTLDSDIIIDVGCYGLGKYKDNRHPFTLCVLNKCEDMEQTIIYWDNPIEIHHIIDEQDLVDKISELAYAYSKGGIKYPPPVINTYIHQYCHICDCNTKHTLCHTAHCDICSTKELSKNDIRYCPYCICMTNQEIDTNEDKFNTICLSCKNYLSGGKD